MDDSGLTEQGQQFLQVVQEGRSFSGRERHCLFLNAGGVDFIDTSAVSGFDLPDDGRALAQVDWNNDGALDFWISNRNGPQVRLLMNQTTKTESGGESHFLSIRLNGTKSNRDAIGSRVRVFPKDDSKPISRTLVAGDGFLSQSSKQLHFGLGKHTAIDRLEIRWPNGTLQTFAIGEVDCTYHLVEGTSSAKKMPVSGRTLPAAVDEKLATKPSKRHAMCFSMITFPQTEFTTYAGSREPLMPRDTKLLLVNLWAKWCDPCVQEIQDFTEQAARLRKRPIDVVVLSVEDLHKEKSDALTESEAWLKKTNFPFRFGRADNDLITKLQLLSDTIFEVKKPIPVPTSFLLDGKRRIVAVFYGQASVDEILAMSERLRVKTSEEWRMSTLPFKGLWIDRFSRRDLFDYTMQLFDLGYVAEAREYVEKNQEMFTKNPGWRNFKAKLDAQGTGR